MKDTTEKLLESDGFTSFIFNNISSAIFLVDKDLRVRKVNDSFKALFSKEESEVLNRLCGDSLGCSYAVEQDKPCGTTSACNECTIRNSLTDCFSDASAIKGTYVTRSFYIQGEAVQKHLRLKTRQVCWDGQEMAIIAIDDITELEEQKQLLKDMAETDFLTKLYNRRHFFDIGENLFQTARRGDFCISVAMFDIDFFKRVNDTWGHAAGDFVIKSVADILSANLRKADVLARFGGEEFCLILHCKEPGDAYTVVDKLRLMIELHAFVFEGRKIDVTISAGLTSHLGDSLEEMVKKADEMLYRAKDAGRNRTEEYSV
jgi:diguanylate cyclase (GGDEF) domain